MAQDATSRERLTRLVTDHLQGDRTDVEWSGRPLRDQGLDSMSVIELVLDLEAEYDITFPDNLLVAETFETLESLHSTILTLIGETGR